MDRVRWIKTPEEVEALEAGARLLDEAYLEVLPTVRAGETERLVHSRIIESCLRRGANWAHGILNSSRNTVSYGGESDTAFESGDIIRNDYVSYLNGYPGHQSRSVCVGTPSEEQKRAYRVTRDIYRATIDRCRPGAKTADIYHFANDSFHEAGFQGNVSLAGHGVGAWWHQQEPYMVPSSARVLEEGDGGGAGAAHRLLAPAGHGAGNRRRAEAAVASDEHGRDAGGWLGWRSVRASISSANRSAVPQSLSLCKRVEPVQNPRRICRTFYFSTLFV